MLDGKDPMLPNWALPFVDVRDVALMHLRALERPETAGRRYLAVTEPVALFEIGRILKTVYPTRRMPTRAAPEILVRMLALFDHPEQMAKLQGDPSLMPSAVDEMLRNANQTL